MISRLDPALKAGILVFVLASGVGFLLTELGWSLPELVRDPAQHFGITVLAGFFSWIGIGFLVATLGITLFAAGLSGRFQGLLRGAAAFSGILALDDMFTLHELARDALGVPELAVFAVYAALGAALLWRLRAAAPVLPQVGFFVAVGFLAASVLFDLILSGGPIAFWLEDFSKLAGYAAWLAFWSGAARVAVTTT